MFFDSFSLRITYNVSVNPKCDFGIGMTHLLLYDCWRNTVCHHLAGCPVPRGMEAASEIPNLIKDEVKGAMARSDKIVATFQSLVAQKGEKEVLY